MARGDQRAQVEFNEIIHDALTGYLARHFGSQLSDDDLQEVLDHATLDLLVHAGAYRGKHGEVSAWKWVYKIARNRAYKWIRTRNREIPWYEESDDDSELGVDRFYREIISYNPNLDTNNVEEIIEMRLFFEKVMQMLQQLTPREKQVITLLERGYQNKEIAAIMRVSPPRVTQIIQSIRLKLLSAAD